MAQRISSLTFQITAYPGEYQIYVVEDAGLVRDGRAISTQMTKSEAVLRSQDWTFVAQIVTKLKSALSTGELFD